MPSPSVSPQTKSPIQHCGGTGSSGSAKPASIVWSLRWAGSKSPIPTLTTATAAVGSPNWAVMLESNARSSPCLALVIVAPVGTRNSRMY